MDISSVNSDLIRGNVTTIILSTLSVGDRYGYDILKEIESKSAGKYKLKQPTLYSVLKRLEKQGLIESYLGEPDDTGGGRRRYYKLTEDGKNFLDKEKSEYEFSRTLLDKLVSDQKFDLENADAPFNVSELRPYTKKKDEDGESSDAQPKEAVKEVVKEVVKEKLVFKYIDAATGRVVDPADILAQQQIPQNPEHPTQIQAQNATAAQSQHAENPQTAQITQNAAQITQSVAQSAQDAAHSTAAFMQNTEAKKQDLQTPAAQAYQPSIFQLEQERAQKTENAFTNHEQSLGEQKPSHPLSPQKTLSEVFSEIDNKPSAPHTADAPPRRVSILDILAEREEAKELQRKLAAEREEEEQNARAQSQKAAEDIKKEAEDNRRQNAKPEKDEFVPSYVLPTKRAEFEFEKQKIDYRSILGDITKQSAQSSRVDVRAAETPAFRENQELKTKLYAKGYKVKPYTKANTAEYYSFNFVLSARLNRDSYFIVLLCYIAMIAVMWAATGNKVGFMPFLSFILIGIALYAIPLGFYFHNPSRRARANFNFKLSILNRAMLAVELLVIVMLVAFFFAGADIKKIDTLIAPVIIPSILLINIPLSSAIHYMLYRTKKYHIT